MGNDCSEDIDECQTAVETNICPENTDCINQPGGYQCVCQNGYKENSFGQCEGIPKSMLKYQQLK